MVFDQKKIVIFYKKKSLLNFGKIYALHGKVVICYIENPDRHGNLL